jgi:hypothetical protein
VKDINGFFQSHPLNDLAFFVDSLFRDVLDRYQIKPETSKETTTARTVQKPYIILSESFSE